MQPFVWKADNKTQIIQRSMKIIPQKIFGIFGPPSSAFPKTPRHLRMIKRHIAVMAQTVQITTENPKEPACTLNTPP